MERKYEGEGAYCLGEIIIANSLYNLPKEEAEKIKEELKEENHEAFKKFMEFYELYEEVMEEKEELNLPIDDDEIHLTKEDLEWEDDSKLMKEIHNKYSKYYEKMNQLDEKYSSNEITNEEYCYGLEELLKQLPKRGEIIYDLTKIRKRFNEVILSRLSEEILKRNNIDEDEELIREELFEMREIIEVPFGSIIYFLALEDEKPALYVELASRMGSDDLYVIKEDSYDCDDIYDGYPPEIKDKYFGHLKNIKETKDRFRKIKK